jgi:hypothetical protein
MNVPPLPILLPSSEPPPPPPLLSSSLSTQPTLYFKKAKLPSPPTPPPPPPPSPPPLLSSSDPSSSVLMSPPVKSKLSNLFQFKSIISNALHRNNSKSKSTNLLKSTQPPTDYFHTDNTDFVSSPIASKSKNNSFRFFEETDLNDEDILDHNQLSSTWDDRTYLKRVFDDISQGQGGYISFNQLYEVFTRNSVFGFDPMIVHILISNNNINQNSTIRFDQFYSIFKNLSIQYNEFLDIENKPKSSKF